MTRHVPSFFVADRHLSFLPQFLGPEEQAKLLGTDCTPEPTDPFSCFTVKIKFIEVKGIARRIRSQPQRKLQ